MKNNNHKSTFAAILFFGFMFCVAVTSAYAQNEGDNPILRTTGASILPAGKIQWNNTLGWDFRKSSFEQYNMPGASTVPNRITSNMFNYGTNIRFGIGDVAEIVAGVEAGYHTGHSDVDEYHNSSMLMPSVGVKVKVFDGNGVWPMVSFRTDIALPIQKYWSDGKSDMHRPEPSLELLMRKKIGNRFFVDGTVGYGFHQFGVSSFDDGIRYTLAANWLATERLALGVSFGRRLVHGIADNSYSYVDILYGMNRHYGIVSMMYQLSPDLQLSLQGCIAGAASLDNPANKYNMASDLMVGVHWMIK